MGEIKVISMQNLYDDIYEVNLKVNGVKEVRTVSMQGIETAIKDPTTNKKSKDWPVLETIYLTYKAREKAKKETKESKEVKDVKAN